MVSRYISQRQLSVMLVGVAWVASVVLFVAAVSKASLVSASAGIWGLQIGDFFVYDAHISAEVVLACALLLFPQSRPTQLAGAATFSVYSIFAIGYAAKGAPCNCFGDAQVNATLVAAFDVAVAIAFVGSLMVPIERTPEWRAVLRWARHALMAAVCCALALTLVHMSRVSAESFVLEDGRPVDWPLVSRASAVLRTGEVFPLIDFVEHGGAIADGEWDILVVRPGCEACRKAIGDFELITTMAAHCGRAIVILPSVDDRTEIRRMGTAGIPVFRLRRVFTKHRREVVPWTLPVPVRISLSDGVVVGVRELEY